MKRVPLLTTAYLAPIEYFAFLMEDEVQIEYCEHFHKQSYRNRAIVMTGNGPQVLSIPIIRGSASKMMIADTRIEYKTPWQRNHWKTIESAYGNSPFFLYYQDPLRLLYESCTPSLLDFNMQLTQTILKLLRVPTKLVPTTDFQRVEAFDLRTEIHPKKREQRDYPFTLETPYSQVFDDKHGFVPNLSILDLLFNVGPETSNYLKDLLRLFDEKMKGLCDDGVHC